MSKWTKEELENMLEDVVNELELSDSAVEKHGQLGTAPAELVRLVLDEKDLRIRALDANVVDASKSNCNIQRVSDAVCHYRHCLDQYKGKCINGTYWQNCHNRQTER